MPQIRLGLGKREFSTGLTFVALSRVKSLAEILFVDTTWETSRTEVRR